MNKMIISTLTYSVLLAIGVSCGGGKKEKESYSSPETPSFEGSTSAEETSASSTQKQQDYNPEVTSHASIKVYSFLSQQNYKFCHLTMATGNHADRSVQEAAHLRCMDEMGRVDHLNFGDDTSFQTDNAVTNFTQMLSSIIPVTRNFSIKLINCSDTYTESTFNELTTRQEKNCYFRHMEVYQPQSSILSPMNAQDLHNYFSDNNYEFCQVAFYSGNDEEKEIEDEVRLQCSNPESSPEAFIFAGPKIEELKIPSAFENFTQIMGLLIPEIENNNMQLLNCADAESSSSRNLITFTADKVCYFIKK